MSPPKPGCRGAVATPRSASLLSSAGFAPCTACCTPTRRGAPPTWFTRRLVSPSNLVPNFPGIRRACGTRVRVVSVRPHREADGRTDVVAVVLHSVCVCTEGCCAAPVSPAVPALPARPRCLLWPGRWRGTGPEHLTVGHPRGAGGPHAMRGERPQALRASASPGLASPIFFFYPRPPLPPFKC